MNKIIDLSFPLEEDMPFFPSGRHTRFESEKTCSIAEGGREIRKFTIGSHCGTHMDAFSHFLPGRKTIDLIPLEQLAGEALLVSLGRAEPGMMIEKEILEEKMPAGKIGKLLIRTEWSRFWKTDQYFKGWPLISRKCAEFIVERGVELLGLDFPSPDPAYKGKNEEDSPIHKLLFENDVILVEYLNNLSELKEGKIFFTAMPLKLKGFDGSPVRAAAWEM